MICKKEESSVQTGDREQQKKGEESSASAEEGKNCNSCRVCVRGGGGGADRSRSRAEAYPITTAVVLVLSGYPMPQHRVSTGKIIQ